MICASVIALLLCGTSFAAADSGGQGAARRASDSVRVPTPPMGWTSWNAFTTEVDQELVEVTAKALVEKGLAAHGYLYVNVDSCWQGNRSAKGTLALQPSGRFPDMAGMVQRIHALGLKAGIYSTPMVHAWGSRDNLLLLGSTGYPLDPKYFHPYFGGCGQRGFEEVDARQFAQWGFDWLKYDWNRTEPYHTRIMRKALDKTGREIVLQVCTGCKVSNAVEYASCCELVRGNTDTRDDWVHLRDRVMKRCDPWLKYIRPGFWYDLDMLALGAMRIRRDEKTVHPARPGERPAKELLNRMTQDEQTSHFAWWAIIPMPLFLSCDIVNIDDFTLSLVTNDDLIAINQDYPAKPASFEDIEGGKRRIWARELSDGRKVLGFFNLAEDEWRVDHPLAGMNDVRDALAKCDLGGKDRIEVAVRPHACKVYVIGQK